MSKTWYEKPPESKGKTIMSTTIECDRCGSVISSTIRMGNSKAFTLHGYVNGTRPVIDVDLCETCMRALDEWIKVGPIDEEEN